jgi:hypothetical protein
MTQEKKDMHKKFAVDCFNGTWDLLDKNDRTDEENFMMIRMAHASRYHWGEIGSPLQFARGDWQISRVYAVLGMGRMAYDYAKTSLDHCMENDIGDFDLAFAYEALLRASMILDNPADIKKFKKLALDCGKAIQEDGNRTYFLSELKSIPGFDDPSIA